MEEALVVYLGDHGADLAGLDEVLAGGGSKFYVLKFLLLAKD